MSPTRVLEAAATGTPALDELVNFIARGPSTLEVAEYRASAEASARVADLIRREKTTGLSPDEAAELDRSLQLEHLMRLAKARARLYLAGE